MLSVALAQIRNEGSITHTIEKHKHYINRAIDSHSDYVLFPELSLTGYIQETANEQAVTLNHEIINEFKELSTNGKILISVGAPLFINNNLYITSLFFIPNEEVKYYIKRFLHPGEDKYYSTTFNSAVINRHCNCNIASAICYDIENEDHINSISNEKIDVYSASIFYSKQSIKKGLQRLSDISRNHQVNVIMANYVDKLRKVECGGNSSILDNKGNIIISANDKDECMVLASLDKGIWINQRIED